MSIDYGERERQFLETLKADTGRSLDEWMAAISAQGLTQRNDIIDWLRRQNFMFSKASWLERIHNNGGQPIYSGGGNPRVQARPRNQSPRPVQTPAIQPDAPIDHPPLAATPSRVDNVSSAPPTATVVPFPRPPAPPAASPPPKPSPSQPVPAIASPSSGRTDPVALDTLIARAKAFRPLAAYLIAEIRKAVPDVTVSAHDSFVGFRVRDKNFGLIAISPKELRLGLALKSNPTDGTFISAKLPTLQGAPAMTHMAVLNDARQVTASLLAAISQAAAEP